MHVCEIWKRGTDEPICRARINTWMQKTDWGTVNRDSSSDMYTTMCKEEESCYIAQGAQLSAL